MLKLLLLLACSRAVDPEPWSPPSPYVPAPPTPAPPTPPPSPGPTRAVHDTAFVDAAVTAIDAASTRVRLASYVLYRSSEVDRVLNALSRAADRGVEVRVLLDEEGDETEDTLLWLTERQIEAALDGTGRTLHSKLLVADDVAIVGSHNLTHAALLWNHEGAVLVRDAEVADWYASWFDAVWTDPSDDPELAALGRQDLQPLADRQVFPALQACIDGATERVDLLLYALAWDPAYPGSEVEQLVEALELANGRGVQVNVTLDASSWIVQNEINVEAIERLELAGLDVVEVPGPTTHAKVLLCDQTAIVSDANWSYSGLVLFHGTSLQTTLPAVVDETRTWIEGIRADAQR